MTLSDPRIAAFCSSAFADVFHGVATRHEVWRDDPFDVESIHEEARTAYQRLVHRASTPPAPPAGRILLLKGEAGSGKTHLMRAIRNWTHSRGLGYCGYLQMTSATDYYDRYVLNNLIDSLDQPYYEPHSETTGLMRLSAAVAEAPAGLPREELERLREAELDYPALGRLVDELADRVVLDERFNTVDTDLVRALLFLQRDDPRIKGRVLKYLRCGNLSPADRQALGGLVPRVYAGASSWVIQRLGEVMAAVESVPLILCLDQLEDMYDLDDARAKFRRAMVTVRELADRVPSSIIVIACLEDYYEKLREHLSGPLLDRIEQDPEPVRLKGPREEPEVVALVRLRLAHLFESLDLADPGRDADPTYPIPAPAAQALVGQRTRDVLGWCRRYRERCITAGQIVSIDGAAPAPVAAATTVATTHWEQDWNDFRAAFEAAIPTGDDELATQIAWAVSACNDELDEPHFSAEPDGRFVRVERPGASARERLLIGVCNRAAQGGGLGNQVTEVSRRAESTGGVTPIVVRSTAFPTSPKAAVVQQLGELVRGGGRRVVVEDSDWRALLALRAFREARSAQPSFSAWLREGRPLSRLASLRAILDLDRAERSPVAPSIGEPPPEMATGTTVAPPEPSPLTEGDGPIIVGVTLDRSASPVEIEPAALTRHAAFLGGTGSGKTTLALQVIEGLLLRGVPALLVDRKGDLCGYASPDAWLRPPADPERSAERDRLRDKVDVAVYTPGNPNGRPLSIAIAPAGLGRMKTFEREQMARYAASALGGMLNYSPKGTDQSRLAILIKAIDVLSQHEPDRATTIEALIGFVHEQDPALLHAVGMLDLKHLDKLVQDLETLRLTRGKLLDAEGEPLDAEALLGLGRHARPGRTRLSIVSTKFLGSNPDIQFWVSQLLVELTRWMNRLPAGDRLQAVLLLDEADLYLPATRQPATKEPLENLLKRARSAGLGILLASQSPGDLDYKGRDNIRSWFVGKITQPTALAKMKPMLSDCRVDVASRLPGQEPGEFHLLRDGQAIALRARRCLVPPAQLAEDAILALARRTLSPGA